MILRPTEAPTRGGSGFLPAWPIIEQAQRRAGEDCWLITQPDHAKLSGEIAAAISAPEYPRIEADVVAGIALHDEGWRPFDTAAAPPISFLDADPRQIAAAWIGSIEAAEQASPVAAILVSLHFARIARSDVAAKKPEAAALMEEFLRGEEQRQAALLSQQRFTREELESFTDVLQFCDLLSLYLCCGAVDDIEFPQRFAGKQVRLRNGGMGIELQPSPFAGEQSFWVRARRTRGAAETAFGFGVR